VSFPVKKEPDEEKLLVVTLTLQIHMRYRLYITIVVADVAVLCDRIHI